MTVKELIAELQTMPQDAQVIYACYSEYDLLNEGDITLHKPSDKKIELRKENGYLRYRDRWHREGDKIVFPEVVVFPGS